jgi:O-acetyl-ADP-ribose deacetylase (regulator of RNase III)
VVRCFGEDLMHRVQQCILDRFFGAQPVGTAFVLPTDHPDLPFLVHAPTMRVPGSIEGTDKVYATTWAALLAIHAHNLVSDQKIEVVAFPAMGTGFGGVPFGEAARQMAAAYRHYREPPHRLDWASSSSATRASATTATGRWPGEDSGRGITPAGPEP